MKQGLELIGGKVVVVIVEVRGWDRRGSGGGGGGGRGGGIRERYGLMLAQIYRPISSARSVNISARCRGMHWRTRLQQRQ